MLSAADDERRRVVRDLHDGAQPGSSGLVGLEDRVAALDGRLLVESPPGAGTVVRATLPLPG